MKIINQKMIMVHDEDDDITATLLVWLGCVYTDTRGDYSYYFLPEVGQDYAEAAIEQLQFKINSALDKLKENIK